MMKSTLIFMLLFLSLPLMAEEIVNIRMGDHADKSRIVIDFTGEADFQAKIENQTLIIHLLNKNIQQKSNFIPPFQSIETSVINDQFLKLSIPLSAPHKIKTAFVITGNPHRLVVDVVKGEGGRSVHGPLAIDKPKIETTRASRKPIIMIDAGHGGYDSGAVAQNNIKEKDIVLSIAKILLEKLNANGRYKAKLTRDSDVFIPLYDRIKIAKDEKADLFISIHADSLRGEQALGASVYTISKTASDAQTAQLVARENSTNEIQAETADTNINEILVTMAIDDTIEKSKRLADTMISELKKSNIQTITDPHRHGGFVVLKSPEIPSVLFETGFISDKAQAQKLIDPSYQRQISKSLLKALDEYFGL